MSKLTAAGRDALPQSEFAGKDRSYPVDTKKRAIDAKGRAKQQLNRGALSQHAYESIISKANRKLGK